MKGYAEQITKRLVGLGRAVDNVLLFGPQPTRLKMFPGGECPMCHGRGGSHGPEHGLPCGWTCGTCGGSGSLGRIVIAEYLPYPDSHPNHGGDYERTGWTEPRIGSLPMEPA